MAFKPIQIPNKMLSYGVHNNTLYIYAYNMLLAEISDVSEKELTSDLVEDVLLGMGYELST